MHLINSELWRRWIHLNPVRRAFYDEIAAYDYEKMKTVPFIVLEKIDSKFVE